MIRSVVQLKQLTDTTKPSAHLPRCTLPAEQPASRMCVCACGADLLKVKTEESFRDTGLILSPQQQLSSC